MANTASVNTLGNCVASSSDDAIWYLTNRFDCFADMMEASAETMYIDECLAEMDERNILDYERYCIEYVDQCNTNITRYNAKRLGRCYCNFDWYDRVMRDCATMHQRLYVPIYGPYEEFPF